MLDLIRKQVIYPPAAPLLSPITTPVRELDDALWALLLKPGRLTSAECAMIEARELAWRETHPS